jgi:hypothetical protein
MLFGQKISVAQFEQKHLIYIATIIIIIGIIFYIMYLIKYMAEGSKISKIKKEYDTIGIHKLESYDYDQCLLKYKNNYLSDFYIASSANSFLVGNQKYDYANIEMIKSCIIMGARYIELEILCDSLDINAKPIVTTGTELGQWQTSLNNINFGEVCQTITDFAFNEEVKTYQLPFFIYLKLKVNNNPSVLNKIGNTIKQFFPSKEEKTLTIGNRILNEINPATTTICKLFNHVIIWSDPVSIEGKGFDKIQIESIKNNKFPPIRIHYSDVEKLGKEILTNKKTPEEKRQKLDKLSEYNKNKLSIIYPNKEDESASVSYDPEEAWSYGCHFVAINYQLNDDNRLLYFNKFQTDSIELKPSILRREKNTNSGVSIDNLVPPEKIITDVTRKNMYTLYKNAPVYLRPFNDSTKVITIDNNEILIKTKNDSELNLEDAFLIKPSLLKPFHPFLISLESIKYPNFYVSFNNSEFSIYDWRTKKFDNDVKEFTTNASFTLKQGLITTRGTSIGSENISTLTSIYIQAQEKKLMIYDSTSQSIISKDDDDQNYDLATQATFNMYKLPVTKTFTIRQADSQYVHSEKKLLIKNKSTLDSNGIFEFINEKALNLNIEINKLNNDIHIRDSNGNYVSVDSKGNVKVNETKPSIKTRFYLKENGAQTQIYYSGKDLPLIVQLGGILRLAFENEKNKSKTMFIIGNSFKKI